MDKTQLDELTVILSRIERVALIIERDAMNKGNQIRAREIVTLVEMAMRARTCNS